MRPYYGDMNLPARVRLSKLTLPVSAQLLQKLKRMDGPINSLQGTEGTCAIAIAGSQPVAWALSTGGQVYSGIEPSWRERGLEKALLSLLEENIL